MKLGIFDSGLGGLIIAKAIRENIPDIDIIYLGDTLHLPYGNRSKDAIFDYSRSAIEFLFEQDCQLIVTACNTVSASALRQLQQSYLPNSHFKNRRILGVVVPTLECALDSGYKRIGVIATNDTVQSNIYSDELNKLQPEMFISQKATPLLVPLIENDGELWLNSVLDHYLQDFHNTNIECLILGCTHYPFLKNHIKDLLDVDLISQDEIIPEKLLDYLKRHPEISNKISRNRTISFYVSDMTESYRRAAYNIYGEKIIIKQVKL